MFQIVQGVEGLGNKITLTIACESSPLDTLYVFL